MYKYKLIVEYDGSGFYGFQKQQAKFTIQQLLEEIATKLTKIPTTVYGSGRTDAGVHALGQVVHFDMLHNLDALRLKTIFNFHLKNFPLSVIECENLGSDSSFHARFSAIKRCYNYKIIEQSHRPTFARNLYWWVKPNINLTNLMISSDLLLGQHDFSTFRSRGCTAKSPIRTINCIDIYKTNNIINLDFKAPSFLYHQVRNIVGALVLVGKGIWSVEKFQAAFLAKNSSYRTCVAPSHGLYLTQIIYKK